LVNFFEEYGLNEPRRDEGHEERNEEEKKIEEKLKFP
jgi:hypothetical protein